MFKVGCPFSNHHPRKPTAIARCKPADTNAVRDISVSCRAGISRLIIYPTSGRSINKLRIDVI
jgi:hypothetical protein